MIISEDVQCHLYFVFVSFQLVFEGVVGTKGFGVYAIDDIQVVNGVCAPNGYCDFEGESINSMTQFIHFSEYRTSVSLPKNLMTGLP